VVDTTKARFLRGDGALIVQKPCCSVWPQIHHVLLFAALLAYTDTMWCRVSVRVDACARNGSAYLPLTTGAIAPRKREYTCP